MSEPTTTADGDTRDGALPEEDVPPPRITFVDPAGDRLVVTAEVGESVMQVARRHGVPGIRGDCGGFMLCATCHVYVDPARQAGLPPVIDQEDEMLDGAAAERRPGSRLSCQLPVQSDTDLWVELPERQL